MAGTDFIDTFRSTFMGQRDQVKAERAAEKAEAKAKQAAVEASKAQAEAKAGESLMKAQDKVNTFLRALRSAAEDAAKDISEGAKAKVNAAIEGARQDSSQPGYTGYDLNTNTITYTYKPGDTFGQVITDLGLTTDAGLWGQDGDVAYYTQQLVDQGALDRNGNIPVGTTIQLRKRGTPQISMNAEKSAQQTQPPTLQQIISGRVRKV